MEVTKVKKKLPLGVESFREIRQENFYYVDKTNFIKDLLELGGKVNLFTRPRRFGKSLNISMLKSFFEIETDASLFDGLEIAKEKELCEEYLGKFPVISISLKSVEGVSYGNALTRMSAVIKKEMRRHQYLLDSNHLSDIDKNELAALFSEHLSENIQENSIYLLSEMLHKHYGRNVVILIDEYDVPLDKAYSNGYYSSMVRYLRLLFGEALKTNDYLQFAVITGCLRISEESIFTGLNNFKVRTVADTAYAGYFGFTASEVKKMLEYYGLESLYGTVKEWYNGYLFGKTGIYCPWDVINYTEEHLEDIETPPKLYWLGTSENAIIKMLVKRADSVTKDEIEQLIEGKSINKEIRQELTYQDLDKAESKNTDISKINLWSMLFTTGYLTMLYQPKDAKNYELVIPNKEIHDIFVTQVREWTEETVVKGDTERLEQFCMAVKTGNAKVFENIFNEYLAETISIRDTSVAKSMKENFYHGLLLGLLRANSNWFVKSNLESGTGYADIIAEIRAERIGCVFEMKYAEKGDFDKACKAAVQQIKDKDYTALLKQNGMEVIYQYGIACYKKTCKIKFLSINTRTIKNF